MREEKIRDAVDGAFKDEWANPSSKNPDYRDAIFYREAMVRALFKLMKHLPE